MTAFIIALLGYGAAILVLNLLFGKEKPEQRSTPFSNEKAPEIPADGERSVVQQFPNEPPSNSAIKVLVTGAGGFIGHHLVSFLRREGYWVRGVDLKHPEFAPTDAHDFLLLDLRRWENCLRATEGMHEVYALAADMGGMGFISANHAQILHNNALINIHSLEAARENRVKRYLFTSSACVYPEYLQTETDCKPLKEEDAYPAAPQDAYGWEKLVIERLCTHYGEECGLETRIVRFHNIFGPLGTWDGGREKAPAALCRKIAHARITGNHEIEIWGDGE